MLSKSQHSAIALSAILKKSRNFLALVLSKLYYNCLIYHNLPHHIVKRLQRIQTARTCFIVGKLVEREDIIELNRLAVREHIEWQLLKSVPNGVFFLTKSQVTCD